MRLEPDAPPGSYSPLDVALLALLPAPAFALVLISALAVPIVGDFLRTAAATQHESRREREEQELDRQQATARDAILRLADAIASERVAANEAGAELVRASYRARGTLPPTH